MAKTKIIYDEPGQLCNRFWSYLDTIGWAVLTNNKVKILFWDKGIADFGRLRHNKWVSFPLYSTMGVKLFGEKRWNTFVHRIFPNNRLCTKMVYGNPNSSKYIRGWEHRGGVNYFPKVLDTIRHLFIPNRKISESVDTLFAKYKDGNTIIVGVHMRKGDYKDFFYGKYLYSNSIYVELMRQIVKLYKDKRIVFFIASNENATKETFKEFDIIDGNMMCAAFDLYALSKCDRIIGPPSTFSRWASLMGNVPLYFIFDKECVINSDEQFSPIVDHYHFRNGVELPF